MGLKMRFTTFIIMFISTWLIISPAITSAAENFPFFPSLVNSDTGEQVPSSDFYPPKKCAGCHRELYKEWNGSMHSNAIKDPIFNALWKLAADEGGEGTENLCAGCHTAVGTLAGEITRDDEGNFQMSDIAREGVQCHLCHSIVGTSMLETPTNMPQNASIIVRPSKVMRGPFKDAEPMWHKAEYSELHTKAEFCGNCHNVFHPANNFHIENTYNEWKFSIYAQKGIICQDCHMMPIEKAIETAKTLTRPKNPGKATGFSKERENIFTHEFVGANFTVTAMLGADKHAEIAKKRLKSAASIDLTLPAKATDDGITRVKVRVNNIGAGHNLPTSLTEVRQVWLDIKVLDAEGKIIYTRGDLDEKGNIAAGTDLFGVEAVDSEGHHTIKPWEIERFTYNNTIPPKGYADREYSFIVPKGSKGPINFRATLRYRGYPQAVANYLLGDDAPTLPIVDMTAAEGSVPL
ncbi:MAG: hypothetical protein C0608_01995 [Deltaproteobacteria bacterium]|nr:MAG: hypothetical protein C0608_01995 [Deltaproteobacteria bacterium]